LSEVVNQKTTTFVHRGREETIMQLAAEAAIGEALLRGKPLAIWRKALLVGPGASIDSTLETLKQEDGLDASASIAWMPASDLG
jgi:hypothetical protein